MISYKYFKIINNLDKLDEILKEYFSPNFLFVNYSLIGNEAELFFKTTLTEKEILDSVISNYSDAPKTENVLDIAIVKCREAAILKSYDNLTPLERKVLFNLDLTEDEQNNLIALFT